MINFIKQLDKQLHMMGCYILTLTMAFFMPLHYAALIVLSIGAGKEWYDHKHPQNHTADWLDFVADAIGVFIACLAFIVIGRYS